MVPTNGAPLALCGARRLVLAVFLDGVSRALGANPERVGERVHLVQVREAERWIAGGDDHLPDFPFSFGACCDVLALQPSAVRRALELGTVSLEAILHASDGLLAHTKLATHQRSKT